MTRWRLIFRSLLFHWRIHLSVVMGVMAATAVLTGALLVGDSMKQSLRVLAIERLGRIDHVLVAPRFFRQQLATELSNSTDFDKHFDAVLPAIMVNAALENTDSENKRHVGGVSALGCNEAFWKLAPGPTPDMGDADSRGIVLNQTVAEKLGVAVDDEVILSIPGISHVPRDSALGRKQDTTVRRRLKVTALVTAEGLGRFQLRSSQSLPRNAFVHPQTLQRMLDQDKDKFNTLLIAGKSADSSSGPAATEFLKQALRPSLADFGLRLKRVDLKHDEQIVLSYYNLTSDQMLLPPAAADAALEAWKSHQPQAALTYLANYIQSGDKEKLAKIPYSTITAIDSNAALGPVLDKDNQPVSLADGEVALNSWSADDMRKQGVPVAIGDDVELIYFQPESAHDHETGDALEASVRLKLAAIAPLAPLDAQPYPANDRELTPEVKGLTDQDSIDNWDPPFDYDDSRVRTRRPNDQDERYWEDYRATPKAFVSLATGQRLWGSRFGNVTSVRVAANKQIDEASLTKSLLEQLKPAAVGFVLQPIKEQSLKAASGTTPFNGLFIGFSFFIIAAAVMLVALLFQLGVEQRASELGVLLATGLQRKMTSQLLLIEGAVVALVGGLFGSALGVGYAWLMLAGLKTWWRRAVATPHLELHIDPLSIIAGLVIGVLVSLVTIWWTLRGLRHVTIRQLMTGQAAAIPDFAQQAKSGIMGFLPAALIVLAVGVGLLGTVLAGEAQAGAFMGSGALVLTGLLLSVRRRLRRTRVHGSGNLALGGLAARNAGRNPGRSTLTIGLVASASFLIIAISAFRLAPSEEGTGGFDLIAETASPIFFDLNSPIGRGEMNILPNDWKGLDGSAVIAIRSKSGDDASCTNLYQATQPRVLGMTPKLVDHFDQADQISFAWAGTLAETEQEKANPWKLLDHKFEDGAIPVVIDKNTAMYGLHVMTGPGSDYVVTEDSGREITYRIVGLLANSILQGNLLISEENFNDLYPEVNGYRFFLANAPTGQEQKLAALLTDKLSDQGFESELAEEKLDDLLAVQNTYLSTFQSLGALGLLLGTFGLATVQLRSVMERRGELALMRAAGWRQNRLAVMVMLETLLLLLGGLLVGMIAALVAVLPHGLAGGASVPYLSLATMLSIVLLVGIMAGFAAVYAAFLSPILVALREE